MAELFNDRIIFSKKGGQEEFLHIVGKNLDKTWKEVSEILSISPRTF